MIYVFDTCSFRHLFGFYPRRFPSLWEKVELYVLNNKIVSVREVYNEIKRYSGEMVTWAENKKEIFFPISSDEGKVISEIYQAKNGHFRNNIGKDKLLKGLPVADPFIVAHAKIKLGTVITQERKIEHAARIPNICQYFDVPCINLEEFMEREGWQF